MNIWRIQPDIDNFSGFYLSNFEDVLRLRKYPINKGQKITDWEPLTISIDPHAQSKKTVLGDCSLLWNTGMLLVSEKAKNYLQKQYSQFIEFLPLTYTEQCSYYILNVIVISEALDIQHSEIYYHFIHRNPNQPIIRNIGSYAFDEQKIIAPIFCLKASNIIRSAFIYIVEHLKNDIESSALSGFNFRLISTSVSNTLD